jgi:hypothetical protein
MQERSIVTQDSIVLLNRGDHFEAQPLPREAQFAPVFGIAVGDLDGDGKEDIFLVQNSRGVPEGETPQDAGGALWLRGWGNGTFNVVTEIESGLSMRGDGRGAALCDFDHDGRLDIAAAQNRGMTRLYHNHGATPGLRVHLQGPRENLQAIGASVRVNFKNGKSGPSHAISLGGGYWSQDSTDIILGLTFEPESIQVRWPGGKTESVPVPAGSRWMTVEMPSQ